MNRKPTYQELRSSVKSLLQMIDDKILWRQSLTEDDKEFLALIQRNVIEASR